MQRDKAVRSLPASCEQGVGGRGWAVPGGQGRGLACGLASLQASGRASSPVLTTGIRFEEKREIALRWELVLEIVTLKSAARTLIFGRSLSVHSFLRKCCF